MNARLPVSSILALDTAMNGCSVAFCRDGQDCVSKSEAMGSGQAEHLVPMIQDVLAQAQASMTDIGLIVTTVGPGAFTGMRIGLSTARALGLALSVPVGGMTTCDVLAGAFFAREKLAANESLCVLIETKRSDFYMQLYGADEQPQGEAISAPAEAIFPMINDRTILIGDALERFLSLTAGLKFQTRNEYTLPDPAVMCRLAAAHGAAGLLPPEPVYLRGADVSQSKKLHRKIMDA